MKAQALRCVLVGVRDGDAAALEEALRAPDVDVVRARSEAEARSLLGDPAVALAIADARAPGAERLDATEFAASAGRAVPLLVVGALPGGRGESSGGEGGAAEVLWGPPDARLVRHRAHAFFELERLRRRLAVEAERARRAEEERERLADELRETLRWHETFVAVIGHDLRSPLNAILVGAQLVGRSSDETARRLAGHIGASGQRLSDIVDDLFDVARARQGMGFAIELDDVDAREVVGTVVGELKATHPSRALVVETRGDTAGRWDRAALARVASNLIGNALRHGTGEAPVVITVEGRPDACALEVENAGAIGPELVPSLFDPFRSAQGARPKGYRGLGLGLYISRKLVRAHGGELRILSYGGKTHVTALLPKRPPAPDGA